MCEHRFRRVWCEIRFGLQLVRFSMRNTRRKTQYVLYFVKNNCGVLLGVSN